MDFAAARRNMIDCQVLPNRVTDERVIAAMAETPREAFVPETKRSIAYVDEALAVGGGRYLMEPMKQKHQCEPSRNLLYLCQQTRPIDRFERSYLL